MLGELEDEKEANAAAQRRSEAATAQAAKLQMDLRALHQEAEQVRQQTAAAAQEADARVSCRGQPGCLGHKGLVMCNLARCLVYHSLPEHDQGKGKHLRTKVLLGYVY